MAGLIPFNRNRNLRTSGWDGFYNMLDDFFNDTWLPTRSLISDTFKVDVVESDEAYAVEAELPGVKKNEVDLAFNDGRLTISVRREEQTEEKKKNYIHKERRFSSMQRSIFLADAKEDGIRAKMEDGVLHVSVPKQDIKQTGRVIDIE
ncbi:MAG: Hsp20/alpha crystallin family protein [Christensenellales bacterium]|jgi:HSP20 family protein